MKCNYITIEREYGSGGTKIAQRLSEECGIPCYGREILEAVAKKKNVPVEQIQQYEEKATNSVLYAIAMVGNAQSGNADMLSDESAVYVEEQKEIRQLAAFGKAIFLGHCASEALQNMGGVVRVFIRSGSREEKRRRIREEYGIPEEKIDSTQKYYDKKRGNYYHANTLREWKNPDNYDIVLDSASLGTEGCVSLLKSLFL